MPTTYEPIATTTLGSAQSSVTFSSISGSYTDLVLVFAGQTNTACDLRWQANSDTGTNYSATRLDGDGGTASSYRWSNTAGAPFGWSSSSQNVSILQIQNYSNTTTYKTSLGRGGTAGNLVVAVVGLWRSTSAITSVTIMNAEGATLSSGAVLTLYGIKAA